MNPRKIPLEDRDRIESLYKKLNSIPKIAEIYGVAGITVWRYLKRPYCNVVEPVFGYPT